MISEKIKKYIEEKYKEIIYIQRDMWSDYVCPRFTSSFYDIENNYKEFNIEYGIDCDEYFCVRYYIEIIEPFEMIDELFMFEEVKDGLPVIEKLIERMESDYNRIEESEDIGRTMKEINKELLMEVG